MRRFAAFRTVLAVSIVLVSAVTSASDRLVGFNVGQFLEIDTATCATTPIVPNPPFDNASDAQAIDDSGIFYFTRNIGGLGETLFKWDTNSNLLLAVGEGIGFDRVFAMAISPDGDLFATDGSTNQLLIIDPATGAGQAIGSIPGDLQAIAFRDDGTLFGVQFRSGRVYAIDPETANSEFIGDSGFAGIDAIAYAGGRLFGMDGFLNALVEFDTATGVGTSISQCSPGFGDLDNLPNSLLPATDADGDEIRDSFDNCPDDANNDQSDTDGDTMGDACDPFPDDPDNEQAQCEVDRDQALADLAACEAQPVFVDSDGDGEDDSTDACAGTPAATPVDGNGCSLAQFCLAIDASSKTGESICRQSDWRNDEPLATPKDCAVQKQGRGQPSLCVPS